MNHISINMLYELRRRIRQSSLPNYQWGMWLAKVELEIIRRQGSI